MEQQGKVAFCAGGMEIPARFALIEHGRDVDEVTAEIRQTRFLDPGTVIVADLPVFEVPPFEFAPLVPLCERMAWRRAFMPGMPPLPAVIVGV
jgi:hypothetical protein